MALFDAVVNNTDRKGGHILPVCLDSPASSSAGGQPTDASDALELGDEPVDHSARPLHLYGVDHGVCFSEDPKLRTVLWAWRGEPIEPDELVELEALERSLEGRLGRRLAAPARRRPRSGRPASAWRRCWTTVASPSPTPSDRRFPGRRTDLEPRCGAIRHRS